jgi:hypothetical protein
MIVLSVHGNGAGGGIRTLHVSAFRTRNSPFFGWNAGSGVWRDSIWKRKRKLGVPNVIVNGHGRMESATQTTAIYNATSVKTAATGFPDTARCFSSSPLFFCSVNRQDVIGDG